MGTFSVVDSITSHLSFCPQQRSYKPVRDETLPRLLPVKWQRLLFLFIPLQGSKKKNSSSPSDKQVSYFAYPRQSDDISEPLPISIIICFTCRVFLKRNSKMTSDYCVSNFSYVTWTKKHMMCFPRKNVGCLVRLSVHSVIVIFNRVIMFTFFPLWPGKMSCQIQIDPTHCKRL